MLSDFVNTSRYVHEEYVRKHARHPEPLEQPRHGIRQAIGETLIQIGERLARAESKPLDTAA